MNKCLTCLAARETNQKDIEIPSRSESERLLLGEKNRADEMALCVKALAVYTNKLTSIPGTHIQE